ncbi:hypothetical protein N3Z17_04930 [Candidatus Bandiella numerosa]|uniref:hypothetical protein n=1 Tax=Candidatus Bandiella numerosa TaxID=2570586 RepID=UPI00249EBCB1|nr:hypothetical protein [Candidatus Bandiella numerosa]WHA04568.1 hypothetical protein N3Z17_04930 [Candidatus Bandiella numerosa]
MWLKKPVSVERSKSKIAILLILNVVILMEVKQVKGEEYNFNYIDDYKKEAKEYVGETGKGELSNQVKELDGYTEKPKESGYSEYELRSKGDARVKGQEKDENEGVREAIGAAKSSYAENPHRSNYTAGKLQHKEFIKKSDAVTSNPISGLNVEGKTECKIADKNVGGENVEFEEYYVDVEDSRLIRENKKCEEDEDKLFYCERSIKNMGECIEKMDCGYDAGGMVQGSIDGNIFWRANYPNLYLGTIDKVRDSGRCHIIDKNINFIVKNKDIIKEFRVTNIQYSDWIRISVNGVQAYNSMGGDGPYWRERSWHGGYGEFTNLHSGSVVRTCNTKRFYNTSPNVDLVPYLRDGNNTIRIELAFGNSGRLYVELRATQYCCTRWGSDEWDGDCPL